jgi:hypothetical protein
MPEPAMVLASLIHPVIVTGHFFHPITPTRQPAAIEPHHLRGPAAISNPAFSRQADHHPRRCNHSRPAHRVFNAPAANA